MYCAHAFPADTLYACTTFGWLEKDTLMWQQITAIILNPAFPGWTAPLRFNPDRFEEFASFAVTVCCAWVVSSVLVDGYSLRSTAGEHLHLFALLQQSFTCDTGTIKEC